MSLVEDRIRALLENATWNDHTFMEIDRIFADSGQPLRNGKATSRTYVDVKDMIDEAADAEMALLRNTDLDVVDSSVFRRMSFYFISCALEDHATSRVTLFVMHDDEEGDKPLLLRVDGIADHRGPGCLVMADGVEADTDRLVGVIVR